MSKKSDRPKLAAIKDQRRTFVGIFERTGTKRGWEGAIEETTLLRDVIDAETGETVTDHLWFNYTKGFKGLGDLTKGDRIQFDARVKDYIKGYQGRRLDVPQERKRSYKLSHPTKILAVQGEATE